MQNILFYVGGYHFYGSERKLFTIMKGLRERGYQVFCSTNGWTDGVFNSVLKNNSIPFSTSKLGFIYFRKPLWTLDTLIHYPKALVHHFRIIQTFKPDFVYHNYYRTIIMLFPFLSRHKNIYHVGDLERVNLKNKLIFRLVQYKTKVFIASSYYVKRNLLDLGVKENKIRVVLNGIDAFDPDVKVKSKKIRIGIVGQIIARKGHMDVVEAFNSLRNENLLDGIECLIYGDGDRNYIQSLRDKIRQYKLDQHFIFKGYQKEKSRIYANLDLVIVPSHYEAFGFSAIEPAFFKIPVIVSRTGGLNEIVVAGETGFFFEAGNSKDLLDQIRKFIHNQALIAEMGDAAYRHAHQHFTSKRMIDDIENILIEI